MVAEMQSSLKDLWSKDYNSNIIFLLAAPSQIHIKVSLSETLSLILFLYTFVLESSLSSQFYCPNARVPS